jgi:para-nitrobenzyl esterase
MRSRLWALVLAAAVCAPLGAITQPVKTRGGQVSGTPGKSPSITAFKGIPFAAPPVGNLRWAAPQPAAPWKGVLKAEKFGASCIQNIVDEMKPWTYEFMTHNEISEDCLYLNVWTPAKSAGAKLPVFVYIYGGAFNSGSGQVPLYDGEGLASKGMVVVVPNYRVGIWGFFTHPELTKESGHNASGDWGLLDQVAALQWVRDNIAAFGGDPNRVTIAGQSAGATSVHALTASPLAKGLFGRAIPQSGSSVTGVGLMGAGQLAASEQNGVHLQESKGAKSLADLRAMSVQQILAPAPAPAGGAAGGRGGGRGGFSMVVDGYFLPEPVDQIFAEGKQNDVVTLTGLTADDAGIAANANATADSFERQARTRYGDLADLYLKAYPVVTDAQAVAATVESSRDQARVSMYLWAMNRAKTAKTKAFTYYWNHAMPGPDAARYGAFHSSEIAYVLNTLYASNRPFTDADRKIADMVSSYWANFAATGDPNGKGLPRWPALSEKPDTTMQIGDNPGPIPIAASAAKIEFWKQYFAQPRPAQGRGGRGAQ